MDDYLTYREAASLSGRSIRSINRWRRGGMPMTWEDRDGQRVRVIEKTILQRWFREWLVNNPAHHRQMPTLRKRNAEQRAE